MENILYNELRARGFNIDVGVVEYNHIEDGKKIRTQLEIDFVVNRAEKRYYIQSALTVADEEKRQQEVNSLNRVDDSYTKIVIVKDNILPWTDDKGVNYINIEDFLLEKKNEIKNRFLQNEIVAENNRNHGTLHVSPFRRSSEV